MNEKQFETSRPRRWFLGRMGMGAVAGVSLAGSGAAAQTASAPWRPARHEQDDWLEKIPGQHRFVFDTTTPEGMALALQFCSNYFNSNAQAYGLKDSDLAVLMVARHRSTAFGYNDAMWAKYGKQFSEQSGFTDPKTHQASTANLYFTSASGTLQAGRSLTDLIGHGAHFAVCATSSRGIAGNIVRATGGDTDKILAELGANLIANARLVPAGIVAVNRAQERGYSFVYGG
jgi:hypothetical protein